MYKLTFDGIAGGMLTTGMYRRSTTGRIYERVDNKGHELHRHTGTHVHASPGKTKLHKPSLESLFTCDSLDPI